MFWSLFYDDLLRVDVRSGVSVVGRTDDVATMATLHNASHIENILNHALALIAGWLSRYGLGEDGGGNGHPQMGVLAPVGLY